MKPEDAAADPSGEELDIFFEQSLDLLAICGFDGRFRRLNPAWARLGWPTDELLRRPFMDFVHPADRRATENELANLVDGGETIRFENRYFNSDGSCCWLQWSAHPMPERERIYATARDVTLQRRQEQEILKIADREKERLGQELHDGLCQTLAGIAALSTTLARKLSGSAESGASAAAEEIATLLNQTIDVARDLARGLGPVGLSVTGLDGALDTLAFNVQTLFGFPCTFTCESQLPPLHREIESHVFRIAQEAVNNAVSHSRGSLIEIRLDIEGAEGALTVRDDGKGISLDPPTKGIGLHTMTYRAGLIGATLEVESRSSGGTVVDCRFPLTTANVIPDSNRRPGPTSDAGRP